MKKLALLAVVASGLAGCGGSDSANPLNGNNFNPTSASSNSAATPVKGYDPLPVFLSIDPKDDFNGVRVNLQSVALKSATGTDEVLNLNPGARVDLGALKDATGPRLIFVGMGNKNGAYSRANISLASEAKKFVAGKAVPEIMRLAPVGAKVFEAFINFDAGMVFKDALVVDFKNQKEGVTTAIGSATGVATLDRQELSAFRGSVSDYVIGKSFTLKVGNKKLPVKISSGTTYSEAKDLIKNGSEVLVAGRYALGTGFQAEKIIAGDNSVQLVRGTVVSQKDTVLSVSPIWSTSDAPLLSVQDSGLVKFEEGKRVNLYVTTDAKTKALKVADLKDTTMKHLQVKIRA